MFRILFTLLLCPAALFSQDYVPLLIDSLYQTVFQYDEQGNSTQETVVTGYSYYGDNRLSQLNLGEYRNNYYYSGDTIFRLTERNLGGSSWQLSSKGYEVTENSVTILKVLQRLDGTSYERYIYSYDRFGRDSVERREELSDFEWSTFYLKVTNSDYENNKIRLEEYYPNTSGGLSLRRGKIQCFDILDNLVEETVIFAGSDGEVRYSSTTNYTYIGSLRDSTYVCIYEGSDTINCQIAERRAYDYSNDDRLIERKYRGDDLNDIYSSRVLFYGDSIYGPELDSSFVYSYNENGVDSLLSSSGYSEYIGLENDRIYFRNEFYTDRGGDYRLRGTTEKWFHQRNITSLDESIQDSDQFKIYPNPIMTSGTLNINSSNENTVRVVIFNMNGQLISSSYTDSTSTLSAPDQKGVYSVIIFDGNSIVLSSILLVQ